MKNQFTRKEVLTILNELLERPDILLDAVQNEYTDNDAESLLSFGEQFLNGAFRPKAIKP